MKFQSLQGFPKLRLLCVWSGVWGTGVAIWEASGIPLTLFTHILTPPAQLEVKLEGLDIYKILDIQT